MKRQGQTLTSLALLSLVPLASAGAGGVYIGAGLYNASVDEEIDNVDFDDDDTTGALFLGWRPLESIGAEVGYYDFGEQKADNGTRIEGGAVTLAGLLSVELGPWGFMARPVWPIRISIFAMRPARMMIHPRMPSAGSVPPWICSTSCTCMASLCTSITMPEST